MRKQCRREFLRLCRGNAVRYDVGNDTPRAFATSETSDAASALLMVKPAHSGFRSGDRSHNAACDQWLRAAPGGIAGARTELAG